MKPPHTIIFFTEYLSNSLPTIGKKTAEQIMNIGMVRVVTNLDRLSSSSKYNWIGLKCKTDSKKVNSYSNSHHTPS